jgi:osmotically-inducible protein OsmY
MRYEDEMKNFKRISSAAVAALVLAGAMSGCVGFGRCSPENCASDKATLAQVNDALASHRELGAPAAIHAQVINGVVYLSGLMDTELEVRRAESIAAQVPGVKDVVNSLTSRNTGR